MRPIAWIPSPNCNNDRRGVSVDTVVLHYTAGGGTAESLGRFFQSSQNSAHFGIDRKGEIAQYVSIRNTAWHAGDHGRSRIPTLVQATESAFVPVDDVRPAPRMLNRRSVGIEHVNRGYQVRGDMSEYVAGRHANPMQREPLWQSYPDVQIEATIELLLWLPEALKATRPLLICGHEDACHPGTIGGPGGKYDPGPAFPWATLEARLRGLYTRVRYDFGRRGWHVTPW